MRGRTLKAPVFEAPVMPPRLSNYYVISLFASPELCTTMFKLLCKEPAQNLTIWSTYSKYCATVDFLFILKW